MMSWLALLRASFRGKGLSLRGHGPDQRPEPKQWRRLRLRMKKLARRARRRLREAAGE